MAMLSLRWKKVLRDLWINRSRSGLAILAMTIGMMGASAVLCAYSILVRELDANYMKTNPASAIIVTDAVNQSLISEVRSNPGVKAVEARGFFFARIEISENEWKPLILFVINDFNNMHISKFETEEGDWPPRPGDILIERAALRVARRHVGDSVVVRLPPGEQKKLRIGGSAHDPAQAPAWMEGVVYGYVTRNTLSMLGSAPLNEILLTVAEKPYDKTHIRAVAKSVTDQLEKEGYRIQRIEVPEPRHHPHQTQLKALLFLLQAFGGLSFVLSMLLVVTLINAIMAQQIRQIGVMKAIGARTRQVAGMYLGGAVLLGAIALVIGLPAGAGVARAYARFAADMLNFDIMDASIPLWSYALLVLVGLITPVLAASYPVYRGTCITVREAITDYGIIAEPSANRLVDRVFGKAQWLSRPVMLSLRNTFRRQGRMVLTLGVLAIGGAMFITALDVGASIKSSIAAFQNAMRYDLKVTLSKPTRLATVEAAVSNVPGIMKMEGWAQARASLIYDKGPDKGTDGNEFPVIGPPPETDLLRLRVIEGRWLSATDQNALVVNHIFMYREPHLKVGDDVVLRMGTQRTKWRIVGVIRQIGEPTAFANHGYLAGLTNQNNLVTTLPIVTKDRSIGAHLSTAKQVERVLADAGIDVRDMVSIYDIQKILEDHFVILTMLLLFMSLLIVIVGGLGLMTVMSIQVIERTREIGVMRAIGASRHDLLKVITIEGLVIGVMSWILAAILALPLSKLVGDLFGLIFLQTTLDYALSPIAFLLWLGLVIGFSLLASLLPARGASMLTVRETLVYE
jgi:putative ABC transport system permease protein